MMCQRRSGFTSDIIEILNQLVWNLIKREVFPGEPKLQAGENLKEAGSFLKPKIRTELLPLALKN